MSQLGARQAWPSARPDHTPSSGVGRAGRLPPVGPELLAPVSFPKPGPQAPKPAIFRRQNQLAGLVPRPLRAGLGPLGSWPPETLAHVGRVTGARLCSGPPPPRAASACAHGPAGRSPWPQTPPWTQSFSHVITRSSITCPPVHSAVTKQVSVLALPCAACWKQPRSPASVGLAVPLPALGTSSVK